MTKEQKINANIAAVELLGHEYIIHDKLSSGAVSIKLPSGKTRLFNLFENPTDCLAVVKKFGELYQVSFYFIRNEGWGAVDYYDSPMFDDIYSTLEEAVGAACLEIKVAGYGPSKAYKAAT